MILPHYSRERTTSDRKYIRSAWSLNVAPGYGVTSDYGFYNKPYTSNQSYMKDSKNPYGSRGFRSPGPCESWKAYRSGYPGSLWTWSDYVTHGIPYMTISEEIAFDEHYDLAEVVSHIPQVPPSILIDNRIAAVVKSITQVPADFSVINFLYEAKDFKRSFEHYKRAFTKGGLRLKDIPGWANSTLLDYSFNLSPFVGDILKMTKVWDRVLKKMKFLRDNRGKLVRQSFYNPTLWSNNPFVGQEIHRQEHRPPWWAGFPNDSWMGNSGRPGSPPENGYASLEVIKYEASFAASWYLYQDLQGLDDTWANLRALIAKTGVNNPAKIVWNAIPFSFIVDWMVPFGSLLDYLAIQPFAGEWSIYDMVNSVKETWHIEQVRTYAGQDVPNSVFRNPIVVQRYRRNLGASIDLHDVDLVDFEPQQQLLLSSLFAGNTLFRNGNKKAKKL